MNRDALWARAGVLAARPYKIEFEWDELSDGSPVVVAMNPELPGCMAQGDTEEEALQELEEARQEYIYVRLMKDRPVPVPESTRTLVVTGQFANANWDYASDVSSELPSADSLLVEFKVGENFELIPA